MIPGDLIVSTSPKPGLPNAVGSVWVRHAAGGTSLLQFKAYDQGREKFQGTAQHWVWLDEECPLDVYTECLARTMTTDGNVALTFTPLKGLSPLVLEFMPGGQIPESQVAC
jgi:phage terminase large subunit-like protein